MSDNISTNAVSNCPLSATGVAAESSGPSESGQDNPVVRHVLMSATVGHRSSSSAKAKADLADACILGDFNSAKALIDAGTEISDDLLFEVIGRSLEAETELVELLLANGVDVNHKRRDKTALQTVLKYEYTQPLESTVRLMLRNGASVYEGKKCFLFDAAKHAIKRKEFAYASCLLEADDIDQNDLQQFVSHTLTWISLGDKARDDAFSSAEFLLSKGADVNLVHRDGYTALHAACGLDWRSPEAARVPMPRLVRLLCRHGANVDATIERNGRTALHVLCLHDDLDDLDLEEYDDEEDEMNFAELLKSRIAQCAKILLQYGAKVDARDHAGRTPLYQAYRGTQQLTRMLCENGASVDIVDLSGRTPLHFLCGTNDLYFPEATIADSIKILLQHGAEVDVTDDEGYVPFVLAVMTGKEKVVDLLLSHFLNGAE